MLLKGITLLAAVLALVICGAAGGFAGLGWLWMVPAWFAGCWLGLLVIALLFLWAMCARVDQSRPQEHDSKFYRAMTYLYIDAIKSIIRVRVHTKGLENTPKEGRFLLVCNHLCDVDPALLLAYFKKSQLAFITKQENCSMFLVGPIMHKILCQPLNRENDREALKTILKCIQLIKDDEVSIGVFPEGYTSRNGKLHPFRSGVFKIAQKADVPIVVCTVRNTRQVLHNLPKLKATDVDLHLVGVIPAEDLKGRTAVDIGEQVYEMMLADLGPEFAVEE